MRLLRICAVVFFTIFMIQGCQPNNEATADLYSAIPSNSSLILEISDLQEALLDFSSTRIYEEIDSLPAIMQFADQLQNLKGHFNADSLSQFLKDRPVLASVTLSGADKYDLLFVTAGSVAFEKSIGRKMSEHYQVAQRTYSQAKIFHFFQGEEESGYFVSSYKNLILVSTSATLVEESIRQINSEFNLKKDPHFQKLYDTRNPRDLANLYLNLQESPKFINQLLPNGDASFMKRMGHWAELDIQINNQELIMSGLTLFPHDKAFYLKSFQNISARTTTAQKIVPLNVGLWTAFTFDNAGQYYRNYRQYLEDDGRLRKHDQILEKLNLNAEELLMEWVDTEMGLFATAGKDGYANQVAYLSYRDEEIARKKLDLMADSNFIDGYRGVIIKKMASENALPRFYGPVFQGFHFPYYFVSDGFVIFSENPAVLKGVINDLLDGKTLASSEDFQNFHNSLPARSHLKVVTASPGFLPLLGNLTNASQQQVLEKHKKALNHFQWAALQLNISENAAFTNMYLQHTQQHKEKVNRIWSTQLQSEAANTPQFLKNHVNKKYDIAIQDKDHRLYLLDYNGKILWTKMLDGPIMGEISQVDVFKNNKLQMVLNTPHSLYLIDRLGRDVEEFPVKLTAAATAPVGVFNYERARIYRLVVPVGENLINYDVEGQEVEGWDYEPTGADVITQPQHFAIAGKDVIVVETEEGHLLQLNRRGETRFETIKGLPGLHIPFYLKEGKSLTQSEMLTIADDGKLYAIHPGGPADDLYIEKQYPADYFLYFDDKYILASADNLIVKSDELPWHRELDGDITSRPKAMIFRNEFYAGAYSASAEEIRLYNQEGEIIDGFPVFAQGPFDMGSLQLDGAINVVTYNEDGTLICYRME